MADCIFCKIIAGEIPSTKVYEDETILAFQDIAPAAPTHVLFVPKKHFANLGEAEAEDAALLGRMLLLLGQEAQKLGVGDGYRVVINNGASVGQSVEHLHMHLLGGKTMDSLC